jgi:hypothetical protein
VAVDLEKLPGWAELEESVRGTPHGLTIMLSASVVALQAHAVAQENMLDRMAEVLAAVLVPRAKPPVAKNKGETSEA